MQALNRKFLIWGRAVATVSWWIKAPRDGFTALAWREMPRMMGSPFSDVADQRGGYGRKQTSVPRLEDLSDA